MRRFFVGAIVLAMAVACGSAQAATVYGITFDHGAMTPAPADYTAAANEILPSGVHGVLLGSGSYPDPDHYTGNLVNPNVPGPQGGQALNMMMSGSWPNKQGYFFGNDPVPNGDNYGTHTYPTYGCPDQIGSAGPVIANTYTIEAVVRPDYSRNPGIDFGLTNVSVIYDSVRADVINTGATISVDQNTGILTYQSGAPAGFGSITSSFGLQAGQWYHIAVVVRGSGDASQQTELWINGALDGIGAYPLTWETQGLLKLPGYFTIGTQYWPLSGRNRQGQIDALAISDAALGPGNFVIPEPASLFSLGAGLVALCGAIRRSRRR